MVAWNITIVYYNLALVKKIRKLQLLWYATAEIFKEGATCINRPKTKIRDNQIMMKSNKKDIIYRFFKDQNSQQQFFQKRNETICLILPYPFKWVESKK